MSFLNERNFLTGWAWAVFACFLATACVFAGLALARGFGANGKKILRVGNSSGPRLAVPYLGERFLLGGTFYGLNGLMRLESNGVRDRSFGRDGYVAVPALRSIRDAAVQPDGKIVVVGDPPVDRQGESQFLLVRLLPNGGTDRSFGSEGVQVVSLGEPYEFADSVAVQSDGRIIAGGFSGVYEGRSSFGSAVIVRLGGRGELDRSFSGSGWRRLSSQRNFGFASAVDIAPSQGGIVVAIRGDGLFLEITRLHRSGGLDQDFGRGGSVVIAASEFGQRLGNWFEPIEQVGLVSGGRIVVAGTAVRFRSDRSQKRSVVAARYLRDGKLDRTFGVGGIARAEFRNFAGAFAFGVQPTGRLFVAGNAYVPKRVYVAAVFRPNGRGLDSRFGHAGKVKVGFARRDWVDRVQSVILQPHGRAVLAGYTIRNDHRPPYPRLTALARFGPHRVR
jgi:uncharacterized delta-60 repeat protein